MKLLRTILSMAALAAFTATADAQTYTDTGAVAVPVRDSLDAPPDFLMQTANRTRMVSEEGLAAFYPSTVRGKSIGYAFHNSAARGTIIEVTNQNNGRRTYVKVLGPIPATRTFHNCIIGISASARAALGVRDERTRCTLRFAGY